MVTVHHLRKPTHHFLSPHNTLRNNNLVFLSAQISFKHTEAYLVLGNEAKRISTKKCHGLQQENKLSELPHQCEEKCTNCNTSKA